MAVEEGIWEKEIDFHVQTSGFLGQEDDDGEPSGWSYLSAAVLQYNYGSERYRILVNV